MTCSLPMLVRRAGMANDCDTSPAANTIALTARLMALVRDCPTLNGHEKQKLTFYTRQLLCALAPTNMAFVNPKARASALETNGESFIKGLENVLHDLEQGAGLCPITQNDPYAFEVGRNLAI